MIKHKKHSGVLLAIFLIGFLVVSSCAPGTPQPRGWSGAVLNGNTLVLGAMNGSVVTIDKTSGALQWSASISSGTPTGGAFGCSAPSALVAIYGTPAVSGDMVYVGTYIQQGNVAQGKVYAFIAGRDEPRWVYPPDGFLSDPVVGGLVVSEGKVYFGAADGKVYAVDATDGHKIAEFQTGDKIWSTPIIDGNILYIGSFDKKLYALDTTTLTPVNWGSFTTGGAVAATPLVTPDTIYIGSLDRELYAIDKASGNLKWKFHAGNWFWAQPVIYNNNVYAPGLDHKLYILNVTTGAEVVPPLEMGSPIYSSPVQVDGKVIIASEAGLIYSLDTANNQIKLLTDQIKETIYAPLTSDDSTVYIHTNLDSLYVLNSTTGAVQQFHFK